MVLGLPVYHKNHGIWGNLYIVLYYIYLYVYIVWDREMGQSWAGPTKLVKLGHFEHDITKIWGSVDSFDPHRTHI